MQQAEDFRTESRALHALLAPVDEARYSETTQFKGWTINDVLGHLHFWNIMAEMQLTDEAELMNRLGAVMKGGTSLREFETSYLGDLSGKALLEAWHQGFERTADEFAKADPKARLKWAGPEMSARSSITARLMETWAHGQEVYDVLGAERQSGDHIRNIVVLGVNTFGWTYKTRGETPPGPMPQLKLIAPSGELWEYGEASESGLVEGLAEEFCQVVTQTRNVADTSLVVTGDVAKDWMSKAQCFAGALNPPPEPGTRYRNV
ncbi:MAG: TIGR03084 family metal-binding protein [Pseudomonadota bacterium]